MNRAAPLILAYAAIACAIFFARPAATPGPLLRDFEAYWSAGVAANAGDNPYERGIWNAERRVAGVDARRDELLPFAGPPSVLPLWRAFARLPYAAAARLWLALLALALLSLVAAVLQGSGVRLRAQPFFAALALALAFGPITSDLALGQIALASFAAAALLVVVADRSWLAACASGVIAFFQPNVVLGLLSQLGRNRATLSLLAAALCTLALAVAAVGPSGATGYLGVLAAHAAAERFVAIQLSPAAIAYGFGVNARASLVVGVLAAIAAVISALAIARNVREPFARFAAFAALTPFAAAFVHEHDLVVAYGAALWCALRTRASTRAIALAGTLLVSIDWLGLAQRPSGLLQSALLAVAAACAFLALGEPAESRSAWQALVPLAALFLGGALLAYAHPAPIWPDSMAGYHVPAGASAAQVWLAEQRATGLLAVSPAWAFLRSLSLLGCALLAGAIYRHCPYYRTE